jgi:hypothetical protein
MTTDMPTWLTGLFVVMRMARSAAERPRNSHTSPVRVSASASTRVIHMPAGTGWPFGAMVVA